MRIGLHLLVIGFISICCSNVHAGWYCVSIERLTPPAPEVKQDIETHLLNRYQAGHVGIGYLDRDFYLAWPQPGTCKTCYYHLIRRHGTDLTELLAFLGGGVILFNDVVGEPNPVLKDDYSLYFLKQNNKSHLMVGIPKSSEGVLLVQAASPEVHLPSCDGSSVNR